MIKKIDDYEAGCQMEGAQLMISGQKMYARHVGTSFVLKEDTLDSAKLRLFNESIHGNIDPEYPMLNEISRDVEVTPIREHSLEDIMILRRRAGENIYKLFMDDYPRREKGSVRTVSGELPLEDYWKAQCLYDLPDEIGKKLAGLLVIDIICMMHEWNVRMAAAQGIAYEDIQPIEQIPEQLIREFIDEGISYSKKTYQFDDNMKHVIIYGHNSLKKFAPEYADRKIGEIMEEVLDAKYMYLSEETLPAKVMKVIAELPECILPCDQSYGNVRDA